MLDSDPMRPSALGCLRLSCILAAPQFTPAHLSAGWSVSPTEPLGTPTPIRETEAGEDERGAGPRGEAELGGELGAPGGLRLSVGF